jgi:hypothetical protein
MQCAVKMGSGVITYVLSFITTGSGIRKSIGGVHRHTDIYTQWRSHKLTFFFFKIEKYAKNKNKYYCMEYNLDSKMSHGFGKTRQISLNFQC